MTNIEQLILDLCPNGVEFKKLGEVTYWSQRYNGVDRTMQPKVYNYPSYMAKELEEFESPLGTIRILYTGNKIAFAQEKDVQAKIIDAEVITIPGGGNANVKYYNGKFITSGNHIAIVREPSILNTKYLYYWLTKNKAEIESYYRGAGIKHPDMTKVLSIEIPVPPLEIQKKIVECLDKFSALAAELQAELQKRRTQYEYYRTRLLTPPQTISPEGSTDERNWKWMTLGEIAKYRRGSFPQPYGYAEWYDGDGAMPFVQVADVEEYGMRLKQTTKQFISQLAMPKSVYVPQNTVIVTLQGSIGKVAITQYDSYVDRTLGIFESYKININKRYFAYQLERIFAVKKEKARGGTIKTITKEEFTDFALPIPPLEEQERIVAILDKFESLTTSLSEGIPAEQAAQQKRYEYYRDLLLTFKKRAV